MKTSFIYHLNKIWFLKQLATTKDFKSAAYNLGVTPSALTQAIKSLESHLEQTLIIREKGNVRLTTEGLTLLEQTNSILDEIESLDSSYQDQKVPTVLRIGAYDSLAIHYIPIIYSQLMELNPKMKVDLIVGRSHELITQVNQGHLDLALVIGASESDSYYSTAIKKHTLSFYTSKENVIDGRLKDGLNFGCLRPEIDGRQSFFTRTLEKANLKSRDFTFQTDSLESLISLTNQGAIISLLPTSLAKDNEKLLNVDNLIAADDLIKSSEHEINLICRKTFPKNWREVIEGVLNPKN